MQSSKSKSKNQLETCQFKVTVLNDVELVYAEGREGELKETLFSFEASTHEGEVYEVYLDLKLMAKRGELFRGGHRLVLVADTDNISPVLYAADAWFDRHRPG